MLGCGRSFGTKPLPRSSGLCRLGQAPLWKRKWLEKRGKKPLLPEMLGRFSAARWCCHFPRVVGSGLCPALSRWEPAGGTSPPPVLLPSAMFEHPGVFWFYLISEKTPRLCLAASAKPLLAALRNRSRRSISWGVQRVRGAGPWVGCSRRWAASTVAWDSIWGLLSPGGSPRGDLHAFRR